MVPTVSWFHLAQVLPALRADHVPEQEIFLVHKPLAPVQEEDLEGVVVVGGQGGDELDLDQQLVPQTAQQDPPGKLLLTDRIVALEHGAEFLFVEIHIDFNLSFLYNSYIL